MGHENSAVRSWLPQVGTLERKILLKKLKRGLERRGMTRREVYEGLLQLATTPQVSVTRWCARDDTRQSVISRVRARFRESGQYSRRPGQERRRMTRAREDRLIA